MKTLFLSLTFLFTILFAQSLEACLNVPDTPPDVEISGDPCNTLNPKLTVRLLNYTTSTANTDEYCACALNIPFTYGFVSNTKIVHTGTSNAINGYDFSYNANVYFNSISDWQGFLSGIAQTIDADIVVDLVFEFTPESQYDCDLLLTDLIDYMENATEFVGTAIANQNGFPDYQNGVFAAEIITTFPSYCATNVLSTNRSSVTDIEAQTAMIDMEEISCKGAKFKMTNNTQRMMTDNCYFIISNSEGTIIAYNETGEFTDLEENNYEAYGYCTTGVLDDTILGLNVSDDCFGIDTTSNYAFQTGEICIDMLIVCEGDSSSASILNIEGGSGNYVDISWFDSSGTQLILSDDMQASDLPAGTYTVLVADDEGNIGIAVFTIDDDCGCCPFFSETYTTLGQAPCGENCSASLVTTTQVQTNSYFLLENVSQGSEYLVDLCSANDSLWSAQISVVYFDTLTNSIIDTLPSFCSTACFMPCNFEYEGNVLIMISEWGNCGTTSSNVSNGLLSVSCASSVDCPESENTPPTAIDDFATTFQNVPVTIDVIANDFDAESALNPCEIVVLPPANGMAMLEGCEVLYIPNPDFIGEDCFQYEICDEDSLCATANVCVNVNAEEETCILKIELDRKVNPNDTTCNNGYIRVKVTIDSNCPAPYQFKWRKQNEAWPALWVNANWLNNRFELENLGPGIYEFQAQANDGTKSEVLEVKLKVVGNCNGGAEAVPQNNPLDLNILPFEILPLFPSCDNGIIKISLSDVSENDTCCFFPFQFRIAAEDGIWSLWQDASIDSVTHQFTGLSNGTYYIQVQENNGHYHEEPLIINLNNEECEGIACDNIVITDIAENHCIGSGYELMVGTDTYNETNPSGTTTLIGSNGCDSIVNVNLIFDNLVCPPDICNISSVTLPLTILSSNCEEVTAVGNTNTDDTSNPNYYYILIDSLGNVLKKNQTGKFDISDLPQEQYYIFYICIVTILDDSIIGQNVFDGCLNIGINLGESVNLDEICIITVTTPPLKCIPIRITKIE